MSVIMSKTRSSAEVWLMGKGTEELSGSHLSTNADAFRLLLFFQSTVLVIGGGQRSYFVALPLALGAPVTFARLSRASFMSHLLAPPLCRAGSSPWLAFGMEWSPIGSPVTS